MTNAVAAIGHRGTRIKAFVSVPPASTTRSTW
jgi:hypothetical protein